jgi:lycopene cyclase domain-containing protein
MSFYKRWNALFVALPVVALFFIVWDELFTRIGVWSFNKEYLTGIFIGSLPLEEWMFFFFVPYSCIFIYDSLKYFFKKDWLQSASKPFTFTLIFILIGFAIINYNRLYTSITFAFTSIFLIIHYAIFKTKYLGRFYFGYLIHLIPFFIVNGILTAFPVVMYNNSENLGIRMYSIPVEDSIYSMLLLIMNITIYEFLNERNANKQGYSTTY